MHKNRILAQKSILPIKRSRNNLNNFIVYIREFDKFTEEGIPLCRNRDCYSLVSNPLRKYCSKHCRNIFEKWYNSNFYWKEIRSEVFRRDDYTCTICGIKLKKKKKLNKNTNNWLECDHIIPIFYYKYMGYKFDTLENKIKTILEYIHNKNNLRTVCNICHKEITSNFSQKKRIIKHDLILDEE